jgi:hypothetical protein
MSRSRKIRLALVAGAALVAASPVTISSSGKIQSLQACADGTCCTEERSICFINDIRANDAYYKGTGSCINQT